MSQIQDMLSFGTFRLLPSQRQLLEDETPVRLGGRAVDILIFLVENAGTLVRKDALMAFVWPRTVVDENSLRVHLGALGKVLGDGLSGAK